MFDDGTKLLWQRWLVPSSEQRFLALPCDVIPCGVEAYVQSLWTELHEAEPAFAAAAFR